VPGAGSLQGVDVRRVKSGEHRLCREQQPVGEFPTLRLAQQTAEQATD
jgi:hypothetical protein